eukprot:417739_1
MAPLLCLIFVLSAVCLNVNGYSCKNETCLVNCTLTPEICSNSIINGKDSILLNITCNSDSICNNLQINCPHNVIDSNTSSCNLICNGNHGCNNIQFYTFNSNSSSIQCGNEPNIITNNNTLSICSNIIISSLPKNELNNNINYSNNNNTSQPNITIDCYQSETKSTCQNISFEYIINTNNVFINCENITNNKLNYFNIAC